MHTRRGLAVLLCSIAFLLTARPAHADGPAGKQNPDQTYSLYTGFNYMTGSQDGAHIERKDIFAGAGYRPHPLFEFVLALHVGNTNFKYNVDFPEKQLTFNAGLQQTAEPWVKPGIRVRLLNTEKLSLHLFSDLELPLSQRKDMDIKSVHITAPQLGDVDATNFFNDHVKAQYTWYSLSLGVTGRYKLGKLEPRIDLGVRRFYGGMDLKMDSQSQSILRLLGYQDVLKTSYPLEYTSPVVSAGADYRFNDYLSASATGMAFPTSSSWLFGAGGSVQLHW